MGPGLMRLCCTKKYSIQSLIIRPRLHKLKYRINQSFVDKSTNSTRFSDLKAVLQKSHKF